MTRPLPAFDPDVAQIVEAMRGSRPMHETGIEAARRVMEEAPRPEAVPMSSVEDAAAEGPHGPIPLRVYRPGPELPDPAPALVYFHGGGMVMGTLDSFDPFARRLAAECHAVVVSVDYRLAPEHPYPAGNDDAWAAFEWTSRHADRLGVGRGAIGVVGDSAGGSLAASVALRARDGGPHLALQVLLYPGLERASVPRASMEEWAQGPGITREDVVWMKSQYLGEDETLDTPYGVPSLAEDLRGLAPAIVVTAECDPLRDGGEAYGERLRDASVPNTLIRYPGVCHGFMAQAGWVARGLTAFREVGALARTHLHAHAR